MRPLQCDHVIAPAKINLHLEIVKRRQDGYHDLRSLFLMVSLSDTLTVRRGGEGTTVRITGVPSVDQQKNTVTEAIRLFREATCLTDGILVTVQKFIPPGSGLGGGSSDAASVLRCLNHLSGSPLSPARLRACAEKIGSDVPFFLAAPCALVEGRGDRVFPLPINPDFSILLIVPDFSVSTADAYRWIDETGVDQLRKSMSHRTLRALRGDRSLPFSEFYNSFYGILKDRFSVYRHLEECLSEAGALYAGPSGSGSSFFGVFRDNQGAERCRAALKGSFRLIKVVRPLTALPAIGKETDCREK